MHRGRSTLVAVALALALLLDGCDAKKGQGKSKKSKTPVVLGASKLTKYIKCEGCRKFATELYGQAQALLSEHKGRKKMGEEPVLEMLEAMCNEGDKGGEWLNGIDVVGTKGELQLQTKDGFQDCSSDECKAVVRVCDSVKTEAGESDLAEMIYRGHYMTDADAFAQRICTKMTESCGEAPVVLKDARIDEPFAAMDSKKWEAKKMQKMMKGMGMGAQMYDRESMADMLAEEGLGEGGGMSAGLGGAGGMGEEGGSGAHPPPPAGDAPPAFPMQDVFKEVHQMVMSQVDTVLQAAEPIAQAFEAYAMQAVESFRGVVASITGNPKTTAEL